jgi:hypothetical protein
MEQYISRTALEEQSRVLLEIFPVVSESLHLIRWRQHLRTECSESRLQRDLNSGKQRYLSPFGIAYP